MHPESRTPSLRTFALDSGPQAIEIPPAADTQYLSHGYFRFIGRYPPQLVSWVLNAHRPKGPILDPMCGGGTTLVEARLRGIDAVGSDVNPVSRLVSRVASTALDPKAFAAANAAFLVRVEEAIAQPKRRPQRLKLCREYFSEETLKDLASFHAASQDTPEPFRDVHLLGLLAILRRITRANIKKMNLEIDARRTTIPPLLPTLRKRLEDLESGNAELVRWARPCSVEVVEASAHETGHADGTFGAVFLHPPYLTNTAFSEFTQLQLAVLGIPHKRIWRKELRCRGSFLHERNGLRKYLIGWQRILAEAYRVLRPGGLLVSVVGDGQIDYVRIPIGAITLENARDLGYELVDQALHVLNNNTGRTQSRKMKGQHLAVFRKPK